MRVDQVFVKCGFEIVDAKKTKDSLVFDVRIRVDDPKVPTRWRQMLGDVLAVAEIVAQKPNKKWEIDISKRFYARNGGVRYRWRIQITGDLVAASQAIVASSLNALRTGNELSTVPLVGSQTSRPDPANGKYKGAYPRGEDDRASQVVAAAFTVGTG